MNCDLLGFLGHFDMVFRTSLRVFAFCVVTLDDLAFVQLVPF